MVKFKFSYDKENDDLFLFNPKSKSKGSVEIADLVFDYDSKMNLVGLQIMNASIFIKETLGDKISSVKTMLNNLKECNVDFKLKNNFIFIKINLLAKEKKMIPITVPNIRESSPALRN